MLERGMREHSLSPSKRGARDQAGYRAIIIRGGCEITEDKLREGEGFEMHGWPDRYEMLLQKAEGGIRKLRRELEALGDYVSRNPSAPTNLARRKMHDCLMKTLEKMEEQAAELRKLV
jgi:hypothetical protein